MALEDRWHRKDRTRTAEYGKGLRWRAVWSEGASPKKKSFASKDAAKAHLAWIEHNQRAGTYISQDRGRVFVKDLLTEWFDGQLHLKPSTRNETAGDMERHLRPYWGDRIIADIRRADIQTWVAGLDLAPTTVATLHGRFKTFLNWCVQEGRIVVSPAVGVKLPPKTQRPHTYLKPAQVALLADSIQPHYSGFIWGLTLTGMRMGELTELRFGDIDQERKRANISRAVVWVKGTAIVGTPKSGKPRDVPLTSKVLSVMGEGAPGDLIFTSARGQRIRPTNFRWIHMKSAVRAACAADPSFPPGLYPHDLRHTAASLAVSAGANIKALQRMLGHAKAEMTLSTYAGLFDSDLNDVADRLDGMFS
jgi:integrase